MEHKELKLEANDTEEAPRIEAISVAEADRNGEDCMGCAGKPYC